MTEAGPVTCAGCGLLCDDVTLREAGGETRLSPDCSLGAEWFHARLTRRDDAAATIDGRRATVDAALARAAELLRKARRPLVHGFAEATVEDARAAIALADRLGALIACGPLSGEWPGVPALALRGACTATLGEIRDRSRLVVIWRADPQATHPRLLERLRLGRDRAGEGRTLVVVDDRDTATGEHADLRLSWPRERDLEALIALHVINRGLTAPPGDLHSELSKLQERIEAAPHLSIVHGGDLSAGTGGQRRVLALYELVRVLSHDRHAVTLTLPDAVGTTGAQDALAWQSGYSGTVDFAAGHPDYVSRPLVSDQGVDVSLCVEGDGGQVPGGVNRIALSSLAPRSDVDVWIATAAAGVHASATLHRLDGIPLTLQAPRPGDAPTAATLLARLMTELQAVTASAEVRQ